MTAARKAATATPTSVQDLRHAAMLRFGRAIAKAHEDDSADLLACASPALRFEDPVSRVNGHAGIKRVMDDTWRLMPGSRFVVRHQALSGDKAYTRWDIVRDKDGREQVLVSAVGESTLDEQGVVLRHVDYWDSVEAIYRKVPLLNRLLDAIRKRVSAGWEPAAA